MAFVQTLRQEWAALQEPLYEAIAASAAGQESSKSLTRLLRAHPDWNSTKRRLAKELVLGIAVWRLMLTAHGASTPTELLGVFLRERLGESTEDIESLLHTTLPVAPKPLSFAQRHGLPEWLAALWTEELGREEAEALATASNQAAPIFVRANTLRCSVAELQAQLAQEGIESERCRYAAHGLRLCSKTPNIYGLSSHQQGFFEVQDEGSQWLVQAAAAVPGMSVLDFCAGAGGKTLGLAAAMQNTGCLVAYDPDERKRRQLRHRALRAGANIVQVAEQIPHGQFDLVFVDAPCSQLGVLRRSPDARRQPLQALESLQREILRQAASLVRPGGRLLYATCTLRRAENEDLAESFLQEQAHFLPATLLDLTGNVVHAAQSAPHRHGTDGFFAAMFQRRQGAGPNGPAPCLKYGENSETGKKTT